MLINLSFFLRFQITPIKSWWDWTKKTYVLVCFWGKKKKLLLLKWKWRSILRKPISINFNGLQSSKANRIDCSLYVALSYTLLVNYATFYATRFGVKVRKDVKICFGCCPSQMSCDISIWFLLTYVLSHKDKSITMMFDKLSELTSLADYFALTHAKNITLSVGLTLSSKTIIVWKIG